MSKPTDNNSTTEVNQDQPSRAEKARKRNLRLVTAEDGRLIDPTLNAKIEYDLDQLEAFLDVVLHAGLDEGEEPAFWKCPIKTPKIGYPVSEDAFFESMEGYDKPSRCYIGTSTLRPTSEGKIRNKAENIVTTRMIVLDDIGTKVPPERINLPPTYIIESSEGNFQYGYVFKEPVDKPDAAAELVALVYGAGLSDAGGKMANKIVRLPMGVNGKGDQPADKALFHVELKELHPERLYSPQEVLSGLGIDDDWAAIYEDAASHAKATASAGEGASRWTSATTPTMDGVVDPVLEWLVEQNLVESDSGEFVTITCPNAHLHTHPDSTAGYRPLGRGKQPETRAFHCFHDHCSTYNTADFLAHVVANGGPAAAVRVEGAELTADWVFDAHNNAVWKIRNVNFPKMVSMDSFKNLFPRPVALVQKDGSTKYVKQHQLWHGSEARVNTFGSIFYPADPSPLVVVDDHLMVNTYVQPKWGKGDIDPRHIQMFLDFITYLIPIEKERNYFLDWLACKAQDMAFRGAAMIMVARKQGTGRTTMADMLSTLFGPHNMANVPFDKMVGDQTFNEWQTCPLVVTDETLNTGETKFFRTYERLKELVDPRPKLTTINPKYGKKTVTYVYSSYMMFSNHAGAVALAGSDRRFYVITNVDTPASYAYFAKLNAWLQEKSADGGPDWCPSVWRWLRARPVDVAAMLAPVEATEAKAEMARVTKSNVTAFAEAYCEALVACGMPLFDMSHAFAVAERLYDRLELGEIKGWKKRLRTDMAAVSTAVGAPVRLGEKVVRLRAADKGPSLLTEETETYIFDTSKSGDMSKKTRAEIKQRATDLLENDSLMPTLVGKIGDLLSDYDL